MAESTLQKYTDIRNEYNEKYCEKRYKGVRIYTDDYAFLKLSEKFYLSTRTIENIVFWRVGYNS